MRSNKKTNPLSGRQPCKGSCDLCNSTSTSRWHVSLLEDKTLCKSCYDKERRKTPEYREKRNKHNHEWQKTFPAASKVAKDKGMPLELTEEQWSLKTKECSYCGVDISNNTGVRLDRVDNSKGYSNENTVGCCRQCNVAKNNHSVDDFRNWIDRVYKKYNIDLTKVIEDQDNISLTDQAACQGPKGCEI